jgi:hypothetical protein
MSKGKPAEIPWLGILFLSVPFWVAAWLSSSWIILAAVIALAGLALIFSGLRRRARGEDSRIVLNGALALVAYAGAALALPLAPACFELIRHQARPMAVFCASLAGGYLSVRLLRGNSKTSLLRSLGLIGLAASLYWGLSSLSILKWDSGPRYEDIVGWRFKWEGPEADSK